MKTPDDTDILTPTLRKEVSRFAQTRKKSPKAVVRKAVKYYMQEVLDYERALAAEKKARSRQSFREIARELGLVR